MANNANLQQNGEIVTLWDVSTPGACVQYQVASVSAREWMSIQPARYVEKLSAGQTPDPTKSGLNRIITDSRVSSD